MKICILSSTFLDNKQACQHLLTGIQFTNVAINKSLNRTRKLQSSTTTVMECQEWKETRPSEPSQAKPSQASLQHTLPASVCSSVSVLKWLFTQNKVYIPLWMDLKNDFFSFAKGDTSEVFCLNLVKLVQRAVCWRGWNFCAPLVRNEQSWGEQTTLPSCFVLRTTLCETGILSGGVWKTLPCSFRILRGC